MDYKEEQGAELEALDSIYYGELTGECVYNLQTGTFKINLS